MLWFMGSQRVRHDGVTEMNGELYLNGSIQYVSFCGWLLSLSIMFLRFMHVLVCIGSSVLLLMSFIPLSDYIIVCLSILLLIDTWAISSFFRCKSEVPQAGWSTFLVTKPNGSCYPSPGLLGSLMLT